MALPHMRAVWLGDGDGARRETLRAGGVEVSGWLPRKQALALLSAADLYVHSALWEGFPLMVAEAAALRVPTLVRRVPSLADIPVELTLDGTDAVLPALTCLLDPTAAAANVAGWSEVLRHNSPAEQRLALIQAYSGGPARV